MASYGGVVPELHRARWEFYSRYNSGTLSLAFPVSFSPSAISLLRSTVDSSCLSSHPLLLRHYVLFSTVVPAFIFPFVFSTSGMRCTALRNPPIVYKETTTRSLTTTSSQIVPDMATSSQTPAQRQPPSALLTAGLDLSGTKQTCVTIEPSVSSPLRHRTHDIRQMSSQHIA